jgi:hypothetical protein
MREALNNQYDVYDSGGIGELDVRALLKQYGERKIADEVSSEWHGGAYATFRRKDKVVADVSTGTGDLSLLYISRWKTPQVAEWFAGFYARAVSQRYHSATVQAVPACSEMNCPVSIVQIATEEGPVIVEHWKDNSVVVSESFDPATAAKLRAALQDGTGAVQARKSATARDWIKAARASGVSNFCAADRGTDCRGDESRGRALARFPHNRAADHRARLTDCLTLSQWQVAWITSRTECDSTNWKPYRKALR